MIWRQVVPPSVDLKRPPVGTCHGPVLPRPLTRGPEDGEDDVGVVGIEGEVDGAGVLVAIEDLLEGLAAVGGAEDAPLGVGAVGMPEDGDEEAVRVARIDDDHGDLLRVAQAEVLARSCRRPVDL